MKCILFDMGETLIHNKKVDFEKSILLLYERSKFCNVDKETFLSYSNGLLKELFEKRIEIEFKMIDYIGLLVNIFGLSFDVSLSQIEEEFAFNSCEIEEIEGGKEILKYFKDKNYKLVLVSNTSFSKNVIIKMLGDMSFYFDDFIVSSEMVFRKPNKNIYLVALRKLSFNKNDVYFIGNDYICDVCGPYSVGIKSIWFNENKLKINRDNNINPYLEIEKYKHLIDIRF